MEALGFAHLSQSALEDLRILEERHEIVLLAYQKPLEHAELTQDQVIKLQQLERALGCRLIAYR